MVARIRVARRLRASFWFLPTVMVAAAVLAAVLLVQLDVWISRTHGGQYFEILRMTEQGARDLLSAIASSMITVAGVTFSITIVTLSLASSQYSSRVLRNFLRDRGNQMVLGVFVAIYAYCLTVLSIMNSTSQEELIPRWGVVGGILLAFAGIGFLIYFIHHVAQSIQASTIIKETAEETLDAIGHLFPAEVGDPADESRCPLPAELGRGTSWRPIIAKTSGYIQTIDSQRLLRWAEKHDTVLRLQASVGDFVIRDTPLLAILGADEPSEERMAELHSAFVISSQRTIENDPSFGIRQLVDIAMKALSPGVNDTTTANVCLDYLTVILAQMIQKSAPAPCRSTHGRLRVIVHGPGFFDLLGDSYEQIRQNAGGNVRVLAHLLHSIQTLAPLTCRPERIHALEYQVELITEVIRRTVPAPADRDRLLGECRRAAARLQAQECGHGR